MADLQRAGLIPGGGEAGTGQVLLALFSLVAKR